MRADVGVLVTLLLVTQTPGDATYRDASRDGERRRREYKRGFSSSEKQQLVNLHNKFRSKEPATNMLRMEWDEDVAQVAQYWADRCVWSHSGGGEGRLDKFKYIGENLFASTTPPTTTRIVEEWYNETIYYNFNTGACSNVCGHYTQVVWHNSYAVGCGIRFCSNIQFLDWRRHGGGYIVVCNYGPGGNYVGQKPYSRGRSPCSECPGELRVCSQKLCSRTEIKRTFLDTSDDTSGGGIILSNNIPFYILVLILLWWRQ